mgnify:CR=1 FL=1
MTILTKKYIIDMHKLLIRHTEGLDDIRDDNLLESDVNNLFQIFIGDV